MFKRGLLVWVIMCCSNVSAAEWVPLTVSVDGDRLAVDLDTVEISQYITSNDKLGVRISATMQYVGSSNLPSFTTVIDTKQCIEYNSGILVNIYNDGSSATRMWQGGGKHMYDAQGIFLCEVVKETVKIQKNKNPRVKPKEYTL